MCICLGPGRTCHGIFMNQLEGLRGFRGPREQKIEKKLIEIIFERKGLVQQHFCSAFQRSQTELRISRRFRRNSHFKTFIFPPIIRQRRSSHCQDMPKLVPRAESYRRAIGFQRSRLDQQHPVLQLYTLGGTREN